MKLQEFWKVVGVDLRPNTEDVYNATGKSPMDQERDADDGLLPISEVEIVRCRDGSGRELPGAQPERRWVPRADAMKFGLRLGDVIVVEIEAHT